MLTLSKHTMVQEQPFDLNLCRNQLPGVVRKMARTEEGPRRAAAKAASAALDPFNFNVHLDHRED